MPIHKDILLFIMCFFVCAYNNAQLHNAITNTQIADSLDIEKEYRQSLGYRSLALKENNHSLNYQKYIQAKWHYTQSCIYEVTGGQDNHKKALEHSLKARSISNGITSSIIYFKHQIANRIYHQYGYTQNWSNTLIEALDNYKILRDTFAEKNSKILTIIDDLGYINTELGDYANAIKYYEKVTPLYIKYYSDNKLDIAMNYNRMAYSYRKLGLRREEFSVLTQAEKIWNEIKNQPVKYKYECYEKLSFWHTYYGNYNLAKTYLNKQKTLIDSITYKPTEINEHSRRHRLQLYNNFIELYLKTNNFENVKQYIDLSNSLLTEANRAFPFDVAHEALNYFFESQLLEKNAEESITLLKKAITLSNDYKDIFFTNPNEYKIALFKKYSELKLYEEAEQLLKEIINSSLKTEENDLFYLYTNYANILSENCKPKIAETYFNKALKLYLLEDNKKNVLSQTTIKQLKPFYSFESINGVMLIADFCLKQYINTNELHFLKASQNLYFLASDIFNNLYLGDSYNDKLYITNKTIENGLLNVLKHNISDNNITKTIEAFERNSSKLTWSKFLYSKHKKSLNVPDSITDKEYNLKTLINHYQNTLYTKKGVHQLETDSLKSRISNLNLELKKLQENIKINYSNYYNRNYKPLNLSKFRETLTDDNLIIKYVFSDENLYCFSISKSGIDFTRLVTSKNIETDISNYVKKLSTFNSTYLKYSEKLKPIILPILNKQKHLNITIIPDGVLNYLPFETLLTKHELNNIELSQYNFSYATSLTLLNEQNSITFTNDNLNVGIFSASINTSSELPNVIEETNNILNYFKGKSFNNISKKTFLKESKGFDILHFAMHSKINNINPDFSSLEFSKEPLLISELYHESINAKLAVLSACETGSGALLKGEGIQSISRAFTYTGIPSTVMSLWKVDDEATAKIMTAFYKHLKAGKSKDIALKKAKKDYINNTSELTLKHPYYWAGFVVSGNTSALVNSNTNTYWLLGIILLLLLLFLLRKQLQFFK